jgi:hypothetical protein
MKLLFKVEDVFEISGRGRVIMPSMPAESDFKIRLKDQIQLRAPDGRFFDTQIAGTEFAHGTKPDGSKVSQMAIIPPRNFPKVSVIDAMFRQPSFCDTISAHGNGKWEARRGGFAFGNRPRLGANS